MGAQGADVYYYHTDYAGSIRAVTGLDGSIVYQADYLPFGTQFDKNGDFDELRGFTGKEYDPDIGLYYFNARWYDAELGRFISEDPAADPNNCNLYTYCGNNPVMRYDPTGKLAWWIPMLAGLFGGINSAANGGDFMQGFCLGALGSLVGYGFGQVFAGAGSFGAVVLGGGVSGGFMGALQGGDFWSSFGMGLFSAGVGFGLDKLMPTKNIFLCKDWAGQALLVGFKAELRSLITKGRGISLLDLIEQICNDYAYKLDLFNKLKKLTSDAKTESEIEQEMAEEDRAELGLEQVKFPLPDWLRQAWRDFQTAVGQYNNAERGSLENRRIIDWLVRDGRNILRAIEAKFVEHIRNTQQLKTFIATYGSKFELWITSYTKSINVELVRAIDQAGGKIVLFIEGVGAKAVDLKGLIDAGGRLLHTPIIYVPDFMWMIPGGYFKGGEFSA